MSVRKSSRPISRVPPVPFLLRYWRMAAKHSGSLDLSASECLDWKLISPTPNAGNRKGNDDKRNLEFFRLIRGKPASVWGEQVAHDSIQLFRWNMSRPGKDGDLHSVGAAHPTAIVLGPDGSRSKAGRVSWAGNDGSWKWW